MLSFYFECVASTPATAQAAVSGNANIPADVATAINNHLSDIGAAPSGMFVYVLAQSVASVDQNGNAETISWTVRFVQNAG